MKKHPTPAVHRVFTGLIVGLAILTLAACPPRDPPPEPPVTTRQPMDDRSPAAPLASTLQVETLEDSVRFTLMVTNTSGAPLELTFPSGQSFDFVVMENGRELWRWSEDKMFTMAIRQETLAPGETRTYHAVWRPPPGVQGRVTVRGFLATQEHRAEQEAEVRLP